MSENFGSISIDRPDQPRKRQGSTKRKKSRSKRKQTSKLPAAWIFGVFVIFLLVLFGAAIYATPYLLKKYLPLYITDNSGFEIAIDKVEIKPLDLHLILHDLSLKPKNTETQTGLLTISTTRLELLGLPLFKGQLVSKATTLDGLRLTIEDDKNDSNSLLGEIGEQLRSGSNPFTLNTLPINISLNNIELSNGSFRVSNPQTGKVYEGEEISLGIPAIGNFSSNQENYIKPYFSAKINGSQITFSGDRAETNSSNITCQIDNLDLPRYLPQLPSGIPITITQGTGNGTLSVVFSPKAQAREKLTVDFDLNIDNMALAHPAGLTLNAPKALLKGSINPFSKKLHLDRLQLSQPRLASSNKISLQEAASIILAAQGAGSSEQNFSADQLQIQKGSIYLEGKQKKPQYNNLDIFFNRTKTASTINISGKTGKNNTFNWTGSIDENEAHGPLTVGRISLQDLLPKENNTRLKGSAELRGKLVLKTDKNTHKISPKLENAKAIFKNIQLSSKGKQWLQAGQCIIGGGQFSENIKNFGNVTLTNSKIDIDTDRLPALLTSFTAKNSPYRIKSLNIAGSGSLHKKGLEPIRLQSFTVKAKSLDSKEPQGDNISITTRFDNKAKSTFTGKGRTRLNGFSLWLSTSFSNIPSREFLPWFDNNELFNHSSTILSGKGVFTLPNKSFTGAIQTGKTILATGKSKNINWQKANITGITYNPDKHGLKISEAAIYSPFFSWTRKPQDYAPYLQSRLFFAGIFSASNPKKTKHPVQIDKISIHNGSIAINDLRTEPATKNNLTGIAATIRNLNGSGNTSASLQARGKLAGNTIRIDSTFNFWGQGKPHTSTIEIDQIPADSALLKGFTSHPVTASSVDLKIYEEKRGKKIDTITDIILTDATSAEPGLNLVLSMLKKDASHTHISLLSQRQHPAREQSIIATLDKYLNKSIIKAETSPFLLSKEDFSDLADKEAVDFKFGEITLTGSGMETLIRLREFLTRHPFVDLSITGEASSMDEQGLLQTLEAKEQQRIDDLNKKLYAEWQAEKQKRLEEQGTTLDNDPFTEEDIFVPRQPEMVKVDPQSLLDLANNRAVLIGQVFTGQLALDPKRLEIVNTTEITPDMENVVRLKIVGQKRGLPSDSGKTDSFEDPF